jgi:hypothetical protein
MQGEYTLFGNNSVLLPIKNDVEKRFDRLEEENFYLHLCTFKTPINF